MQRLTPPPVMTRPLSTNRAPDSTVTPAHRPKSSIGGDSGGTTRDLVVALRPSRTPDAARINDPVQIDIKVASRAAQCLMNAKIASLRAASRHPPPPGTRR